MDIITIIQEEHTAMTHMTGTVGITDSADMAGMVDMVTNSIATDPMAIDIQVGIHTTAIDHQYTDDHADKQIYNQMYF